MRILIDECIDERFRNSFPGHDCQTARYAGLAGLQNSELLKAADKAGFNVFLSAPALGCMEHSAIEGYEALISRGGRRGSIDRVGRVRYAFPFTMGEEKLTVATTARGRCVTTDRETA